MSHSLLLLLDDKGVSVSSIATTLSVSRRAVYNSINCSFNGSRRIRLFISSVLCRPPSLLFSALPEKVKVLDDFEFMRSFDVDKTDFLNHG